MNFVKWTCIFFVFVYYLNVFAVKYNTENILFISDKDNVANGINALAVQQHNLSWIERKRDTAQYAADLDFIKGVLGSFRITPKKVLFLSDGYQAKDRFLRKYYWDLFSRDRINSTIIWTEYERTSNDWNADEVTSFTDEKRHDLQSCFVRVDNTSDPWITGPATHCSAQITNNSFNLILMRKGLCFCRLAESCARTCSGIVVDNSAVFLNRMAELLSRDRGSHSFAYLDGMSSLASAELQRNRNVQALRTFYAAVQAINHTTATTSIAAKILVRCYPPGGVPCDIASERSFFSGIILSNRPVALFKAIDGGLPASWISELHGVVPTSSSSSPSTPR